MVETAWGRQLPFLSKNARGDRTATVLVKTISDLLFALRSAGVEVCFSGQPSEPDPELVRQASRALMTQRQSAMA
jgi:hypothetical protein